MSSRGHLVSIEHLLNNVCATGFQAMYKLLLNCMWYRGSRQIHLMRGNQPVHGLLDTVTLGWLTRGLKWIHDKMAALCFLRMSGVLLVPWAYCLTGRKCARVVRGKIVFLFQACISSDFEAVCEITLQTVQSHTRC